MRFNYFDLKFTNILFIDMHLESTSYFEFVIGNICRFHHQNCCSYGHWVDRFNYNAFGEECPNFSSSLKYQQYYPLNVDAHESLYWVSYDLSTNPANLS